MKKEYTNSLYFDVLDACAEAGCPICHLSDKSVSRYLDTILYESVTDPITRDEIRRSLGYCKQHAWRLLEAGSGVALGIAIIYRDLLGVVSKELAGAQFERSGRLVQRVKKRLVGNQPQAIAGRLQPTQCPACAHRDQMETLILDTTLDALNAQDERLQTALAASDGLCLPHLSHALQLVNSQAAFDTLVAITQDKLAHLQAELDEFIRKKDYRFKHEGFGDEADSWRRAISCMVGAKDIR